MMPHLNEILTTLLHAPCTVIAQRQVGGGCISDAFQVTLASEGGSPEHLFVKCNDASFLDNFECESLGLRQLAQAKAIRTVNPITIGCVNDRAWLVTQWIEHGSQSTDFFETFGGQLADLHRATSGTEIGWQRDNYLGAARQENAHSDSWLEFVAAHRLGFQTRWASDQGRIDVALRRELETIINRLPDLLDGRADETSLLHGDLWSGNYFSDTRGNPVLIDPAVYRGCREAEFGMIRLFGSCPPKFYEAYQQTFPLPEGCWRRVNVYVLYHLLNHLNLFGRGYLSQCQTVAAEILQH